MLKHFLPLSLATLSLVPVLSFAQPTTRPTRQEREAWKQMIAPETDPNSPRHTRLKSPTPDPNEIVRYSLTGHTDHPDVIETWWTGKRQDEMDRRARLDRHRCFAGRP
jgi:hypothetical protein